NEDAHDDGIEDLIWFGIITTIILYALRVIVEDGGAFLSDAAFFDADVYQWYVRVEALEAGQGWFDHVDPRVNPPEGHAQHWTRPLDGLLWIGALLLQPL